MAEAKNKTTTSKTDDKANTQAVDDDKPAIEDKPTSDKNDLSALEGEVIDEDRELTRPAATHEDILAAEEEEKREHDVEHVVQTRAGTRHISAGFPPPYAGQYVVLPTDMWPDSVNPDDHVGHAWQVRQVRTYAEGSSTVNMVCDCGAEMVFTWDKEHAEALANVTEGDLRDLREVPEEFAEPAPRGQGQSDLDAFR